MPAPTADELLEALAPLRSAPERAAVFCDVDGTLSPIVERAESASVPAKTARVLGVLGRRYGCVACISGRSAADARRLVGVGTITYAGTHGAELLEAGASRPKLTSPFDEWVDRVRGFAAGNDSTESRKLRIRIEDKGPIAAFHWRGAPDEQAARRHLERLADKAEGEGFHTHWGRKVLEVRPPVEIGKGHAVRELVRLSGVRTALFAGDDVTDLDGFSALDALVEEGVLDSGLLVGVRSDEGPREIVERAGLAVDGVEGFTAVLEALAET